MNHSLLTDLAAIVSPAQVLTGEDAAGYAIDWRKLFPGKALCVVRPGSTEEVAAVVRACAQHGAGIVPQSGNTGLAGGAVPDASGGEVVISLSRMNRIRALDPVGMTLCAEAGVILQTAKEAAAEKGRFLPISLAAEGSAMLGGVIATNAGGINVLRYGMTRALVLGLEVVLPNGEVLDLQRSLRKDNAGYDLKQLFIGAEGTLGIITAATLRLVPQQRHTLTALMAVESPQAALNLLARAQTELGDNISAFELISGISLGLVEQHFGLKSPLQGGNWFVLMEAASTLPGLRDVTEEMLGAALEAGEAVDGVIAESGAQAASLWALREHITEAEARAGKSAKHDISVPLIEIPAFLEAGEAVLQPIAGLILNVFGHLGDGNLHYNVVMPKGADSDAINRLVHDVVARFGGSISAEHGIGQYRVGELARLRAPGELALAQALKSLIDPQFIMNPGKVLSRPKGET